MKALGIAFDVTVIALIAWCVVELGIRAWRAVA